MTSSTRKYVAEGIGTFVLVFGGVGTAVIAGTAVGFLGVSIAFGLSLLVMAYAIGPISGCHINPAVTLAMVLSKKTDPRDAIGYVGAQIVGAIVAAGMIAIIAKGQPGGYNILLNGLGANGYGVHSPGGFNLASCFLAEVILTAFLAFTVLGATSIKAPVGFAGIAIGLVLTLIHLVSIPITNTSVNPARSIGPALVVGHWALAQLWLFIVAPLLGAAAASGIYYYFSKTEEQEVISLTEAESALESEQRARGEESKNI